MLQNPFHKNFQYLDDLADAISNTLQCPITIEDANHRLLSYSTHHGSTDSARISTIIERRVPEKIINHLWKTGIMPTLLSSKDPIHVNAMDNIGLGNRLAVAIWHKQEVLGFIWALEVNKSFTNEDILTLKQGAEATKNLLMKRKIKINQKEVRHQEFFWKLLTNHYHSIEDIIEKFQRYEIIPPSSFTVVIFQFQQLITDDDELKINYLLNTIQHSKAMLYTIDQQQLILLFAINEGGNTLQLLEKFSNNFITKMNERYEIKPIIQGISAVHDNLLKIGHSYKEALTVLSIKEKLPLETSSIHHYQGLGFYKYFDVMLDKLQMNEFENHSLNKIHDYDIKYNNNLMETLEIYLNCDCNVHEAASILNIHANTLNYRLKRISEIGDINLKDINQKMSLYLDLKLNKFL